MIYQTKVEFECAECNQKYKIYHNSKETAEFCPFCGEFIIATHNETLEEDESDYESDTLDDSENDW